MNTTFLDACWGKPTSYTPVWYMRQAGRYLPAYRKLKGTKNILDIVQAPELAAQISLQPVDILNVDAAILYADIMIPLMGIGVDLEIIESMGPVIKQPIASLADVKKLRELTPEEDIPYLLNTIKILRKELRRKTPLIGFSAAPFTLAGYLIEGKPSRDFMKTKSFMYTNTKAWHLLMEKLTKLIIVYLKTQIKAGIQTAQLFDSWIGFLGEEDYKEFVLPYSRKIFEALSSEPIPLIHFGTNTAGILSSFASVPCNVVGIDWRIPLNKAWEQVGLQKGIQGNLDPTLLLGDFSLVKKRVDQIFASLPKREGYIFNLGHGVLQATPVENILKLTEYIHSKK
ncbi:MAG: uroporphyrinogen decarboxylase [Patescibacteria group bacterium]|nr:uroporphyrinogen decarboxylase [Patescibacteria group bacterium]MDE2588922.1 uroporphyrinogen decarboxylase [Patescibacteria group bacterium]